MKDKGSQEEPIEEVPTDESSNKSSETSSQIKIAKKPYNLRPKPQDKENRQNIISKIKNKLTPRIRKLGGSIRPSVKTQPTAKGKNRPKEIWIIRKPKQPPQPNLLSQAKEKIAEIKDNIKK